MAALVEAKDDLPRWDLERHFPWAGPHDAALDAEMAALGTEAAAWRASAEAALPGGLFAAVEAFQALKTRVDKAVIYINMSCDTQQMDDALQKRKSQVRSALNQVDGDSLEWFELAVAKIDPAAIEGAMALSPELKRYLPFFDEQQRRRPYDLATDVERALTVREEYCGSAPVVKYYNKELTKVTIPCGGDPHFAKHFPGQETAGLEDVLAEMMSASSAETRRTALAAINTALKAFGPIATLSMNVVAGSWAIENEERKAPSLRAIRNVDNNVTDDVVEALLAGVREKGVQLSMRYYRLKKALLKKTQGLETLHWADRNAPIKARGADVPDTKFTWKETVALVRSGYEKFSPTMATMFDQLLEEKRIDVPTEGGKVSGAYCYGGMKGVGPFELLNHTGNRMDVCTLAHESGHACHFMLSYPQGYLMGDPPNTIAECGSIFGEMIVFRDMLANCKDAAERLEMLMEKIDDTINSVVRQASFDMFEELVHTARVEGDVSEETMCGFWRQCVEEFYGKEGEIWDSYEDISHLWTYVSHFIDQPFYVYAYAFADLVVGAVYGKYVEQPEGFEEKLLDLLRAGGSKPFKEALAPLGLDPSDPAFWSNAIEDHLGGLLEEAEQLCKELGFVEE